MQEAMSISAERRRRTSRIRRGVIGGSVAAFAAAWAMIFGQLVTGHDPGLAHNSQAAVPAVAATASGSDDASNSQSARATGSTSPALDPATTRQS
jgi:hypothetical protein